MTDTTLVEMGPFFERHDRKTLRTYVAMLSISLILSAVIFARAMGEAGAPETTGAIVAELWMPVGQGPLTIVALWIASWAYGRTRPSPPDGRFPMNPDDARNVERVANAGAVFVTGFCVVVIAGQAVWLLWSMGLLPHAETWGFRATLVAIGALCVHFGNVSPRLPTPRAPEAKPGVRMKYNRLGGWMTVILGLLLALGGLFLPLPALAPAIGVLSLAVLVAFAAITIMYCVALRSPRAQ